MYNILCLYYIYHSVMHTLVNINIRYDIKYYILLINLTSYMLHVACCIYISYIISYTFKSYEARDLLPEKG